MLNTNNNIKGYLVNDDFIEYVLNPTLTLTEVWEEFFEAHPGQIPIANEARQIILGTNEYVILPNYEADIMKRKIFEKCGI